MKKIEITDQEAKYLIEILKLVFKKYQVDLKPGNKGDISLSSVDKKNNFILSYFTAKNRADKMSVHIREKETNTSLMRINIDPKGFHNNSDGTKVYGHRLLLFSNEEYTLKNDGYTHTKAFELPSIFSDLTNFDQVFLDFLVYINVKQEGKIEFAPMI